MNRALEIAQRHVAEAERHKQAEKSAQSQTLARIEQQAPGITAELSAITEGLAQAFGQPGTKAAYIRIEAGAEVLEIERKPIPPLVPRNSESDQARIAARIGRNGWRKRQVRR